MSKEPIIETTAVALTSNNSLPVNRQDLSAMSEKRTVLREFVKSQLKEGIDGDFAVVPGTQKKSLLQPGAQKLCQLFGLSISLERVMAELDHNGNFAMYVYKATVTHIRSGEKIAECEGVCNSKEKKYATRSTWKGNQKTTEETPVYDILNTLMKMAQKRAMVGAVIQATGASDFFSQDIDDEKDAEQVGVKSSVEGSPMGGQKPTGMSFYAAGETIPQKDALKSLGGKWNANNKRWEFQSSDSETFNKVNSLPGIEAKKL